MDKTFVQSGEASAEARSSTMIAVRAPFTGDENRNGYTRYAIATTPQGPWTDTGVYVNDVPGPPEWRATSIRVLPGSTSYIRITFEDLDGVDGPEEQIFGPIITPLSSFDQVDVEPARVEMHDTEILVSVPIRNDANWNSSGFIDLATNASGPWIRKCSNLPFHPKRGRLRSLVPDTDYWIRVTITDPDVVTGPREQTIGPVRYTGLRNLAYLRPVTADQGWGCCPNPVELVNGVIQEDNWYYGYAWTGGTNRWLGTLPGEKKATIDLGALTTFNRVVVWFHGSDNVPLNWRIEFSTNNTTWVGAYSTTSPTCRTTNQMLTVSSGYPSCAHEARFTPVVGRYVRYWFDDQTLFNGIHGWVEEIEVFGEGAVPSPPIITHQPADLQVVGGADATFHVVVESPVPVTYQWLFNGSPLAGATSSNLVRSAVTPEDVGNYSVIVSNRFGAVTSVETTLRLLGFVPTWDYVRIPGLATNALLGEIWARTRNEVYVWARVPQVGNPSVADALLYRWDGLSWSNVLFAATSEPSHVYGTGTAEVFANTIHGLWRSTDRGATWTAQTLPAATGPYELRKITGTAGNVQVVAGSDYFGQIIRFNGTNWSVVFAETDLPPGDDPPYSATVIAADEGYFVGCWGWGQWNGSSWQFHGRQFDFCDVYDTWALRDTSGNLHWYAVGNNNFANGIKVWKFNTNTTSFGSKTGYVFTDGSGSNVGTARYIWGSAPDDIYVAGDLAQSSGGARRGRLYHYNGTNWTRVMEIGEFPDNVDIRGLTGTASDDVWIARPDGKLMHHGEVAIPLVTPYVTDTNTVLLDHFDGGTSANVRAFVNDGGPCGPARPSATPIYSFGPGPAGLDRAITLSAPAAAPAGSSSYLNYPGGELLSQQNGTLECWVFLVTYDLYIHQLNYVGECQGDVGGLSLTPSGQLHGDIWYTIFNPFSFDSGTNVVPLNAWTHLALSWGDAGAKLYINGSLVGTHSNTGSFASWFGSDSLFVFLGSSNHIDELRVSNIQRTNFNLATASSDRKIGTYNVNYRYNAAGRYTDQSHPDFTQANPYYGNTIPPGPIFINAEPGHYKIITEGGTGCSIWSGDASGGTWYSSYPSVEFDHTFGQIALYFWDWVAGDNDPAVVTTVSVYQTLTESATNITLAPLNAVVSTLQTVQFTATGSFIVQGTRPLTSSDGLTWSTSDPSVVGVNTSGLAVPIRQGAATITATFRGLSASTWLFITNQPPTVTKPPLNRSVSPGAEITWCVAANGSQPMTFQWQLNGTNLPGANTGCLSVSNANPINAGLYSLVLSNPFGTITNTAALSLVDLKMFAGLIIAGPAGDYRIEAQENVGGTNTWIILGTNRVTLPEMPFYYFDTNSPSHSRRFYRSVWMP
jgi:Concanavalin A-like lectin/glucanases superfamily/Immunoglobulin domain